uniref:Uncharacterized protein n=1 Tax=Tanacetum cinerariifolium TaxID=118510 RepID=A0A699K273_TANCI|nr:hypothetical protein [Tanacetum cinerariifolium]
MIQSNPSSRDQRSLSAELSMMILMMTMVEFCLVSIVVKLQMSAQRSLLNNRNADGPSGRIVLSSSTIKFSDVKKSFEGKKQTKEEEKKSTLQVLD